MNAREKQLVMENIRFAYQMAKDLPYYSISWEDRVSLAFLGLVEAALRFDESKGFKFTTFAGLVIRCKMIKEMKRELKHKDTYSLDKPFESLDGEDLTLLDTLSDAEAGYQEVELSDLTGRMQALPKEQCQAVDLVVCQGLKPKKVSKIMRRRESWLNTCVQQGVETLRMLYSGGYKICN